MFRRRPFACVSRLYRNGLQAESIQLFDRRRARAFEQFGTNRGGPALIFIILKGAINYDERKGIAGIQQEQKDYPGLLCHNDYKKTIEYLTNTLNWGPWTILKNNQISAHDVKSDGKPVEGDFEFLIAATFIGDIEFEIIQPIHGVNPYSKFLEERGPGIHHIKESILDNDALDAAVAEYSSRGPKVNYQGKYMEDHYFYLDTFDALGAYYEMGNNAKVSAKPEFVGWYPEEP